MNKNLIALILIVLSVGIFFTVTDSQYTNLKNTQAKNDQYIKAVEDSKQLLKQRERVISARNSISKEDQEKLDKMLPDHVDNVRLIIDITNVAKKRNIALKNIKMGTPSVVVGSKNGTKIVDRPAGQEKYESVSLSFSLNTSYFNFISFLQDLERSLRIIDISKISFNATENGYYDFNVDIKTYWLRQ